MRFYVSHVSALRYWLGVCPPEARVADFPHADGLRDAASTLHEARQADLPAGVWDADRNTLHLTSARRTFRASGVHIHQCTNDLPSRSFVRIAAGTYVASPELCLVQVASDLDLVDCVELCNALCGSYGIGPAGELMPRHELTSPEAIARLVRGLRARGASRGVARTSRALRYATARAASPVEGALACFLVLSRHHGGLGLVRPLMNHPVSCTPAARRISGRRTLYPDFLWPDSRVVLELDTMSYHLGLAPGEDVDKPLDRRARDKLNSDANRVAAFGAMGYACVTITSDDLHDLVILSAKCAEVRRLIGLRNRQLSAAEQARRREVHARLFSVGRYPVDFAGKIERRASV